MHLTSRPFQRAKPAQLSAAARAVAQRAPESITVIRYRAQPTAAAIARLAATAILAYLLALQLPQVTPRPVLAPLTALLVAQVSIYRTVRSAIQRVVAVVTGVLLAVGLSALVGFTWWSLGLTIAVALAIGYALHLGETVLEVPISAMLILSVGSTTSAAATGRIVETLVGAAAGLAAGLIFSRPKVQSAAEAISDLSRKVADLLTAMAAGLADGTIVDRAPECLNRARELGGEIRRVDDALREAEDSMRLNPRRPRQAGSETDLRRGLETLEYTAITVRGLARSLADLSRLEPDQSPVRDQEIRLRIGAALAELGEALRAYGQLAVEHQEPGREFTEAELRQHLEAAQERQDQVSELMGTDPAVQPVGWPLRGELVSHIDRIRTGLEAGSDLSHSPQRWPKLTRAWLAARDAARQGGLGSAGQAGGQAARHALHQAAAQAARTARTARKARTLRLRWPPGQRRSEQRD
jgi:hypothetical protein